MDVRKQLNKIKSESKELVDKYTNCTKALKELLYTGNENVINKFSTKYAYAKCMNLRAQKALKKLENMEKSISKLRKKLVQLIEYLNKVEEHSEGADLGDEYEDLSYWDNNLLK